MFGARMPPRPHALSSPLLYQPKHAQVMAFLHALIDRDPRCSISFRELKVVIGHPDNGQLLVSGKYVQSVGKAERGAMNALDAVPVDQLGGAFFLVDMSDRHGESRVRHSFRRSIYVDIW